MCLLPPPEAVHAGNLPHALWEGFTCKVVELIGASANSAQGLAAVQPKMQAWLGRLGGWADALAFGPVAVKQEQNISKRWDAKDMIGLKVSFPGMEKSDPVIWLDSLLPLVSRCKARLSNTKRLLFQLPTVHGAHDVSPEHDLCHAPLWLEHHHFLVSCMRR